MDRTTQALVRKLINPARAPVKTGIERGRLREVWIFGRTSLRAGAVFARHGTRFSFGGKMRIPVEEQVRLRGERGICATDACDTCGKVLGAIRHTRRGEPGEWCSETCRDGAEVATVRENGRRGGRPPKYRSEAARQRAERVQAAERQKAFRSRRRVTENPLVTP